MSDLMDSFRLDGKVALVTGATYGIGMAIAEALGEAGAKIAFNARHADKVAEAEKHYRELGFEAHGYVADVTDETVVAELIAKIEADFGTTPDILVNNAGVIQRTPMLDMSAEDFRRVVDIDLNAPFIVSKACLPGMIAKGHGKIINICSMMSELGRETIAGYAAAKGGQDAHQEHLLGVWRGQYPVQRHWTRLHRHATNRTPARDAARRQPPSV